MKKPFNLTYLLMMTLLFTIYSCSSDDDGTVQANLQDLEVTIDENPVNGQLIGSVQSDSSTSLTFSLDSQSPSGALSIDASTGELSVADATLFDFEINPTITATVSASGAANTATITINLTNIEVTLQDLTVSIDENPSSGQLIGTVVSNGTGTSNYMIMSQTPSSALSIDATSGELTVADATLFDFETNPVITASISDGEAANSATVTINLSNILEVTISGFDESIDENPNNGDVIGTIQSDAIGNPNFSIVSQTPAGAISIDPNTGVVTVADASLFDYETNQFVDAVIAADDAMNTDDFELEINNVNEIGDFAFGGVIFWIDPASNNSAGLVCDINDMANPNAPAGITWSEGANMITGATGTAIGTGEANTNSIVGNHLSGTYAAWLCAAYQLNGYSDWYLPSQFELHEIYNNMATISATAQANGGAALTGLYHWSSTEVDLNNARVVSTTNGGALNNVTAGKNNSGALVRAVRAWTDF